MYRTILPPVDLDEPSSWRAALPAAVAHCRAFGAALHVAAVVPGLAMGMAARLVEVARLRHFVRPDHDFPPSRAPVRPGRAV